MTPNQYQCCMCHGVFDKEWTDEEAKAEMERDFPGTSMDNACVVCDDCYKKVHPKSSPEMVAAYQAHVSGLMGMMRLLKDEPIAKEHIQFVLPPMFCVAPPGTPTRIGYWDVVSMPTAPSTPPPPAAAAGPSAVPDSPNASAGQ